MKILIAEDDLTSLAMLQALLNKWGYETITATDGGEAWAALQQENAPQLIILDWMMPGMTGLSLCRKLREEERKTPLYIILLTSKSERQDIISGLETGADDYITKPYDNEELRARINVGLRVLKLQIELREREKLQGVLEMAGAVCHELNQPLQAVAGWTELLLNDLTESDPSYATLKIIKKGIDRIGELTYKIMRINRYKTKPYLGNEIKIIDVDNAST